MDHHYLMLKLVMKNFQGQGKTIVAVPVVDLDQIESQELTKE